jgi:hypothetical protein
MCDSNEWRTQNFNTQGKLYGKLAYNGTGDVKVTGRISPGLLGIGGAGQSLTQNQIVFWAPRPPDYRSSYSGSALPFADSKMAFDQTPNAGVVQVKRDGTFAFAIKYPSGYYSDLGTTYVSPHIRVQQVVNGTPGETELIKVGEGIPFRLLTYPPVPATAPRCSPSFYDNRSYLPVRTQEQILRDSCYPSTNRMPANFWGLRPAN